MAAKTGADTLIGMKFASTWGTATTCIAGDKLPVESFSPSNNTTEVSANDIGDGNDMTSDSILGATNPTISLTHKMFYDGAGIEALAVLFGTAAVAVDGDGDKHTLTYNPDRASKYLTTAWENTTTDAAEMETGIPSSASIAATPNEYLRNTLEILGNDILIEPDETTVNDNASLASVTNADENRIVVRPDDGLWINSQSGGALSISDCEPFTDLTLNYNRGLEIVQEVQCASGNGLPRSTGEMPFMVDIPISFRSLDKADYLNAVKNGEEFKAQFTVTGPLIGGTTYYSATFYFPRLKIVADPDASKNNTGENPYSLTFKALVASANPTGMASTYPYVEIVNDKTTAYLL